MDRVSGVHPGLARVSGASGRGFAGVQRAARRAGTYTSQRGEHHAAKGRAGKSESWAACGRLHLPSILCHASTGRSAESPGEAVRKHVLAIPCVTQNFGADENTRVASCAQDRPKLRKGRCLRWADEEELPERVKKPTTPRDNRAFTDRPSKNVQQPSTALSTPSAYGTPALGASLSVGWATAGDGTSRSEEYRPAPQPSYQASSADNGVNYGVSSHRSTSEADISRRATRDRAVNTLTKAHHHRLSRPWGTLPALACLSAPCAPPQ